MPVDYTWSNFELCHRILAHEISHHLHRKDRTSIIIICARLHEDLRGTRPWQDSNVRPDIKPEMLPFIANVPEIRLPLKGTVVARVSYVTPTLERNAPDENWLVPRAMINRQNLLPQKLDAGYALEIRKAVDLVGLLPSVYVNDVSYGIGGVDANLRFVCFSVIKKLLWPIQEILC